LLADGAVSRGGFSNATLRRTERPVLFLVVINDSSPDLS
jgi:hypothetical protein